MLMLAFQPTDTGNTDVAPDFSPFSSNDSSSMRIQQLIQLLRLIEQIFMVLAQNIQLQNAKRANNFLNALMGGAAAGAAMGGNGAPAAGSGGGCGAGAAKPQCASSGGASSRRAAARAAAAKAAAPMSASPANSQNYQRRVLELVNAERAKVGAPPLALNAKLNLSAERYSNDMQTQGFFAHKGLDGTGLAERNRAAGYETGTGGENIAQGQKTPEDVVGAWMNSPGHRRSMLNPVYTEMGIGRVGDTWTQEFAAGEGK
jgi:uncharacterized protein YkwD